MMTHQNAEKFWNYARSTLQLMQDNHIIPTPHNYEVWYSYLSKENPDLVKSVEEHLGRGGNLSEELTEKLYNVLISHETLARSVSLVSDMMSTELNKVTGNLNDFSFEANAYGNTLDGFGASLEGEVSSEALSQLREKMLDATRKTGQKIRFLEANLEESQTEINKLNHYLETIKQEANTDSLTGLVTRKKFDHCLADYIKQASETGQPLTAVFTDIDMYKNVKEKWGQLSADQVLRLVATCVKDNIKGRDIASRYSGEVFAILLPQTSLSDCKTLMNQIKGFVEKKRIVRKNTGDFLGRVTLSIGIAEFHPTESIGQFINRLDRALIKAKSLGVNNIADEEENWQQYNNQSFDSGSSAITA
jgi:diguanylate cyclase